MLTKLAKKFLVVASLSLRFGGRKVNTVVIFLDQAFHFDKAEVISDNTLVLGKFDIWSLWPTPYSENCLWCLVKMKLT